MVNKEQRAKDFMALIKKLDISPTMFKNATEKYKNVAKYLQEHGISADIYPQGSFGIGTVIRPYRDGKDANYDLDCICNINTSKTDTTPKQVKMSVGDTLKESEIYESLLKKEYERCWTIEYADIADIGFQLDIVPAVDEDVVSIHNLQSLSHTPELISSSIAITDKKGTLSYDWLTSNPKGYKCWFDNINAPFLSFNRDVRLSQLFESNRTLYASIEDIPMDMDRSALQRVIQILKRHRDVYFSRLVSSKRVYKPISAIITTVTAQIAQSASPQLSVLELLKYIIQEFQVYEEHLTISHEMFEQRYTNKNIIKKQAGKWTILNPANPKDNLADTWNSGDVQYATYFFQWVQKVKKDFVESFDLEDNKFVALLENSIGNEFVKESFDFSAYKTDTLKTQKISLQSKPYGSIRC